MDHNNTGMCKHCTHVHVPHSHHVGTRTYMHITSGICTQIVAAVKVALMPLYEMIPALVSDEKCPNKRILFTYTHVHASHTWPELLQAWQSTLPLLVSSVSFHWFDYKHNTHMYVRIYSTPLVSSLPPSLSRDPSLPRSLPHHPITGVVQACCPIQQLTVLYTTL